MDGKKYSILDAEKVFKNEEVDRIKNHIVFQNLTPLQVTPEVIAVPIIQRVNFDSPETIHQEAKGYFASTRGDGYSRNFVNAPPENLLQARDNVLGFWKEMDRSLSLTFCLVENELSIGYIHILSPIKYSFIEYVGRLQDNPHWYPIWEIQLWINSHWQRKGIMRAGIEKVIHVLDQNGIAPLVAKVKRDNKPSIALLDRFKYLGNEPREDDGVFFYAIGKSEK